MVDTRIRRRLSYGLSRRHAPIVARGSRGTTENGLAVGSDRDMDLPEEAFGMKLSDFTGAIRLDQILLTSDLDFTHESDKK